MAEKTWWQRIFANQLSNGCGFVLKSTDADNDSGSRLWCTEGDIGIMTTIRRHSHLKVNEFAILNARTEDVGIVVALLESCGDEFA